MQYFDNFRSNTYAGSGNQLFFNMEENEIRTGRVFYKITNGGKYDYSILFSNIMDSTYNDGSKSHKNLICGSWTIHSARVGKCKSIPANKELSEMVMADSDENKNADIIVSDLKELLFGGQKSKQVMPGEFFTTDPINLEYNKGEFLCLEITFSGKMIPYHEESVLPVYVKNENGWEYSKFMPFAGMIGCNREAKKRIAYFGDSITQGIGVQLNSYLHWNALLSEKLGDEYSYWNLGIGYGRANDAASDGAWMYKAKQNDIIFICYGVNDIVQGLPEKQIISDLAYIVKVLKKEGKKIILQTVPPFYYGGGDVDKWNNINAFIMNELKDQGDYVFSNLGCLCGKDRPEMPTYGGHPNEEGSELWANALYDEIKTQGIL